MVPNQILSFIINLALFVVFVLAPICQAIIHIVRLEQVKDDIVSRTMATILYTDEMNTAKEIETGEIFWTLFKKALPSGKDFFSAKENLWFSVIDFY